MLIIISDIHLGDGTCGKSIPASAFHLFADRLRELAINASWRSDGMYRPVQEIDILLMGDILDPLHSTLWLEKSPDDNGYVRPWTDFHDPAFADMLGKITRKILTNNVEALEILKGLSTGNELRLPPATRSGLPDMEARESEAVRVNIHYMTGNHDWYYLLPGPSFDAIREEIILSSGLVNPPGPFPHDLRESAGLQEMLGKYKVFAQHGDHYDPFNYSRGKGRRAASLGDAFVVEVINRFPLEVEKHFKDVLPPCMMENLFELVNIRPALATPLWISSQLRQNNIPLAVQREYKHLWDKICNEFLALPFVQEENKPYKLDLVNGLELAIRMADSLSFKTIDEIIVWARKKFNPRRASYARHALKEEAFLNGAAQFVVYGHTHHHEIIPLDSFPGTPRPTHQLYINSGTWHTYFDLATHRPAEQKFIPYQVFTYLTFYTGDERGGARFEAWTGTLSE